MEHYHDAVRSASEVANRTLVLFAIVGLTGGADRRDILDWLTENDLLKDLTPTEHVMVCSPQLSENQVVQASWLSECLIVFIWSLGMIAELPPFDEQCDTAVFKEKLPPFTGQPVHDFIGSASLRAEVKLKRAAQEILDAHAEARYAGGRPPRYAVDIEIIQERHRAINWVIGYEGVSWDEVTTDT